MVQGMILRFQRSGQFKWINAGIVREGELVEHWITQEGEHFRHVPGYNIKAPITKVYALATTKDGGSFVNVMAIGDADKRKNMSRTTREDSAWKKWPEEMYKKTVLKQLCKMLPGADDFDDEEFRDQIEIEAPSTQQVLGGRLQQATVGERLDQFAKPSDAPEAPTASEHGDGEQVATPSIAEVPAAADHDVESFGPIDDDDDGKAREAYEAGKAAKAIGQRRTSCPGEYRDLAKLSAAWIAGYNGDPPPMV
jgi:recombination protein RecT